MNQDRQEPVVRRGPHPRARIRILALSFLALALGIQDLSSWMTYRAVRRGLDRELGERLLAVAQATAAGIPPEWVRAVSEAGSEAPEWPRLHDYLERVARETSVGNLFLFDTRKRNLYDRENPFPIGFVNPLLDLHFAAVTAALAGVPAATDLYQVEGIYLKAGYAPVWDGDEVVGVVGVEGGVGFFEILGTLRRTFLWAGALGFLALVVLGFLFLRILQGLERVEATLTQSSALAAAGEMAAMVAHEIRNPLAVIRSRAERVQRKIQKGAAPEEILESFEVIPQEVDRLNRIVSGYLSFARPGTAGREPGRVGAAIRMATSLLEGEARRRGIVLELDAQVAEEATVRLSTHDLQQVLVNLLLNAVQALEGQGGRIRVEARESGGTVLLAVEDSGPGIPASRRRDVFRPFYSTKSKGSGLGLAIVKMLVERGGGRVEVTEGSLGGARFELRLPRAGD
jgi:signal transduction histidine kinase